MLIVLQADADQGKVREALRGLGLWTEVFEGPRDGVTVLEVGAHSQHVPAASVLAIAGVADVKQRASVHPRVDAQAGKPVQVAGVQVGAGAPVVLMAGPCSVESREQIHLTAKLVAGAGARVLRGGAFKPRSSPYGFQGHGREALGWLRSAADAHGLAVVTELMSESDVDAVADHADLIQIGSRNAQNYSLLKAVARRGRPVLLKRGRASRVEEWLLAGEHLLDAGAPGVIFCERGVVGFDPVTRNLLDLGTVALLHHVLHQPVVVDPSHAAGRRDLILPLTRAALGAGADGLLVEVHPEPARALSDGPQALDEAALGRLVKDLAAWHRAFAGVA